MSSDLVSHRGFGAAFASVTYLLDAWYSIEEEECGCTCHDTEASTDLRPVKCYESFMLCLYLIYSNDDVVPADEGLRIDAVHIEGYLVPDTTVSIGLDV